MPHMTQGYLFEGKVLAFASTLSEALAGHSGFRSFVMELDEDGAARSVQFAKPPGGWHPLVDELERNGASILFYDPFEAPEYTWISWHEIDRAKMERLVGAPFEDGDFVKVSYASTRALDLNPPGVYPSTWGAMF